MPQNFQTSRPRRVAMISVHASPIAPMGQKKAGGMNVYIRELSRELARRGIQVDVFTRMAEEDSPRIRHELGYGARVISVPAGPQQPLSTDGNAPYLKTFAAGVARFARCNGLTYDLIHSHYWLSGLVAGNLRRAWGPVPVVHMYHTLGHMKNRIARDPSEYASRMRISGEICVSRRADRLIAATPAEREQLMELYGAAPEKITVLPPGVDLARFHFIPQEVARARIGADAARRLVLFVGRMEPLKGIDILLRATALLRDQHPQLAQDLTVMIVGGAPEAAHLDPELARLLALRDALDLHAHVAFVGARDQEDLPDYYAAADFVAVPSLYESFGMVALEAMAMGAPVIASRAGGLAHLVEDGVTGLHVPPGDVQALAERMAYLLADAVHRQELGAQARRQAETYSWTQIGTSMLEIYAEELARSRLAGLAQPVVWTPQRASSAPTSMPGR